ncbi:Na+/H+ antiporter [Candidatus Amarolinea dominans]|uniref:Na+/H+ antiporter n=1 Tax=Candidatus Amarolinea dominans TaxID=3140696 RepID=UPI001DD7CB0C|nr:Na+/H+ antiporter [Anaerolineae bacterium]
MDRFISTETLIIELLLVASLVAILVRRLRVPYTVALVLVGLVLTLQQPLELSLTPELILALLVPPLVFEAAFHINFTELRRNLPGILLLAVVGVILSTLIVGGAVSLVTPLSLPIALVFGALISATDPVAVVALFRALGAPRRLALLVEGESLLNDGTAIVLFNLVLAAALTGHFDLLNGVADFLRVSAGGVVVGLALGWIAAQIIARVDDYLIETTLTTVLAFGAYLVAERLHFSGVLAVVVAGLVNGNIGPQGMSPTTRIVLFNFWEYVAFLANSFIFLLIGLQVNVPTLLANWQPIAWAIVAVLAARSIVTYSLGWVVNRFSDPLPLRWLHVLNWGGLRGAIALALALSLPARPRPAARTGAHHGLWRGAVYPARAKHYHATLAARPGHCDPQSDSDAVRAAPCAPDDLPRGRHASRQSLSRRLHFGAGLGDPAARTAQTGGNDCAQRARLAAHVSRTHHRGTGERPPRTAARPAQRADEHAP